MPAKRKAGPGDAAPSPTAIQDAEVSQIDRWVASRAIWLSDLCAHGVRPMGHLYAYRICHGRLTGESEPRTLADGLVVSVQTQVRIKGQAEQDRIQAKAASAVAELYRQTGAPAGAWVELVRRVSERPDLLAWLESQNLLPRRPEPIRRNRKTEDERQAQAEELAREMCP